MSYDEKPDLPDVLYELTIGTFDDEPLRCPIVHTSWDFARCHDTIGSSVELICKDLRPANRGDVQHLCWLGDRVHRWERYGLPRSDPRPCRSGRGSRRILPVMDDAQVLANYECAIELSHDRVCEISWHPNHDPCENSGAFKIMVFDATCQFWRVRVSCADCVGMAWIMTVQNTYCPCSSEHAGHELGRFRMESIR